MAKKPVITAKEAAAMIPNGATIMCGGFLACGQARAIVKELVALGTKDLTLIANDMGRAVGPQGEEFFGIAELIHNHQVKRVIATHVGMTPEVGQQHTEGTLEVNLLPQGTLAECIRAAGAGLGGVLTPVGIDTLVEESPFCLGRKTVDGKDYLLMKPIHADFALLGTYKCDEFGNCWYKGTMRNFNVVMATAADTVIAETEYLVPVGEIEPRISTPMVCVLTTSWKEKESNGKERDQRLYRQALRQRAEERRRCQPGYRSAYPDPQLSAQGCGADHPC